VELATRQSDFHGWSSTVNKPIERLGLQVSEDKR
jgi:hypothetical protein